MTCFSDQSRASSYSSRENFCSKSAVFRLQKVISTKQGQALWTYVTWNKLKQKSVNQNVINCEKFYNLGSRAGRIKDSRGPHAARGPYVVQAWSISSFSARHIACCCVLSAAWKMTRFCVETIVHCFLSNTRIVDWFCFKSIKMSP